MRALIPALLCAMGAAQSPAVIANADLSFEKLASEKGISSAFLAHLAEGSLILDPEPMDARAHYAKDQDPGALHWRPTWIGISASNDLAYSTGCWEYRTAKDKPVLARGHYLTLWARQADRTWKVAFDCGVPGPAQDPADTSDWNSFMPLAPRPSSDSPGALKEADRRLTHGDSRLQALAFGATIYRKQAMPLDARAAVMGMLSKEPVRSFEPQGAVASAAQDLGYTWGTGASSAGPVSYLHVWVRPGGVWQLLYDLELPIPKKP